MPTRGGSIEQLCQFMNLPRNDDFVLVVAWLLGALRPRGPFPLLTRSGEQGSAKTVLSKILHALIDPNVAPARALPRGDRELFISANNGHMQAFDNISNLSPWLSNTLCRQASGIVNCDRFGTLRRKDRAFRSKHQFRWLNDLCLNSSFLSPLFFEACG